MVALLVGLLLLPFHVGREGKLSVRKLIDRLIPFDESVAEIVDPGDGAATLADLHRAPDFHALAWAHQATPVERVRTLHAQQLGSLVVGKETCRDHPGVVEDKEIALADKACEVGEEEVFDSSGLAVDEHHARGLPLIEWALGNELGRELVVKIGGAHRRR